MPTWTEVNKRDCNKPAAHNNTGEYMMIHTNIPPVIISTRYSRDLTKINRDYLQKYQPKGMSCIITREGTSIKLTRKIEDTNLLKRVIRRVSKYAV